MEKTIIFLVMISWINAEATTDDKVIPETSVKKQIDEFKVKSEAFYRQGNFDESLKLMDEILALNIKTYGEGHLESQIARNTRKMIIDEIEKGRLTENSDTDDSPDKMPINLDETENVDSPTKSSTSANVTEENVKNEL